MNLAELSGQMTAPNVMLIICLHTLLILLAISDFEKRTVPTAMVMLTVVMSTTYMLTELTSGKRTITDRLINMIPGVFLCAYSRLKPERVGEADGLLMICIAELSNPITFIITMAVTSFLSLIIAVKTIKDKTKLPFITILVGAYLLCAKY